MNDGFWCKYCGKQKAWDDRDYDFGLYLAEVASFEALGHTEGVTPYLRRSKKGGGELAHIKQKALSGRIRRKYESNFNEHTPEVV